MKKLFLAVFISFFFAHIGLSQSVTFSDPVMEDAVRESLSWMGVTADSNLTPDNLEQVTYLELDSSSLFSLADLSQLPNLQYLYLDDASGVSDFSPLWELNASLIVLDISMASPSLLSGLPDMESLLSLGLENNKLTDISFLLDNNFSSLTHLDIEDNYLDLGDNATLEQIASLEAILAQNISQGKPTWYGSGVEYGLMYPKGFQNLSSERNRVSSGSDAQSLLLKGIYELLYIFEDRSSSGLQEFAVKVGVESSLRGFLLSDLPMLESYDAELSETLQTDELAKYFQYSFIPALERADSSFAKVETTEPIELSSDLTGSSDDFTVDQADIYVLRAITNLAAGLAAFQAGYDWNFKVGELDALDENDQLSAESLLDLNSNFAGIRNSSMLAKSKAFIEKAIEVYELASPLLRDANRSDDLLFTLSSEDYPEEEDFREDLADLNEAMQGTIEANEDDSIDLSKLFAAKVDLPDLIPPLEGDKFTTSEVSDPTMGGLMPNWDQRRVRQELLDAELLTFAPSSLLGQKLQVEELGYSTFNYFFTSEDAYFVDTTLGTPKLRGIPYSYEKNSSTEASLTLIQDYGDVKHQISFSSSLLGSTTWEDNFSNGIGSIEVLPDEYAPDSLIGWSLEAGSSGTYKFTTDSAGVFYYKDDTNDSNSELSNISYIWELIGPSMGKLTTSLDEVTWLFFETETSGYFDWEELEADSGNSGEFSLLYYTDGHAHESLTGDSLSLGTTTYVFSSDTSVTIHSEQGATTSEYTYLRNGADEGILSIGDSILELDFYSSGYGKVTKGGSDYFRVLANWATRGWVWFDYFPWAYSDNMQDWFYQVLFINDDNESDMAHYQVWDNTWNIPGELHYSGESNFSSADGYYWEDYDDFSGTELNSSKWDVGYWGGGQLVTISNGKAELSGAAFSSSSAVEMPSDLVAAAQGSTEGNTFLFFTDDDIYGIQADISLPTQGNAYEAGIYLASLDVNPLGSLGAELRYETGGAVFLFDYFDSVTELEHSETGSLDTFHQLQITKIGGKTSYYLDNTLIKQFDSSSHDEDYWVIGAFNDDGLPYLTYADNIRVLRKKSYPQGWMWMDYYPWAYSYDSNSWLYFQLAKDMDGQPGMIYWDTSTEDWDLYYPIFSTEQVADQEKANQSLNQN